MALFQRFLVLWFICLVIQAVMWRNTVILDAKQWSQMIVDVAEWNSGVFNEFTHGYPNTLQLLVTTVAYKVFGVAPAAALAGSLTILISLFSALTGTICYLLRPKTLWWLAAPLIISLNSLLPSGTPPTTLVAVSLVPLAFFALWLFEKTDASFNLQKHSIIFGVLWGLAIANRFDFALAVGTPLAAFVAWRRGWKFFPGVVVAAIVTFVAINPYMWRAPIAHLEGMAHKLVYHALEYEDGRRIRAEMFFQYATFSLFGLSLAIISLFVPAARVVSRRFIVLMVGITAAVLGSLLFSNYQAMWYVLPFVLFWETMTPLFLLQLAHKTTPPSTITNSSAYFQTSQIAIAGILICSGAVLLFQHLTLPTITLFLP